MSDVPNEELDAHLELTLHVALLHASRSPQFQRTHGCNSSAELEKVSAYLIQLI